MSKRHKPRKYLTKAALLQLTAERGNRKAQKACHESLATPKLVCAAAAVIVRPLAQPKPGQVWYAGLPQFKKYSTTATADQSD